MTVLTCVVDYLICRIFTDDTDPIRIDCDTPHIGH